MKVERFTVNSCCGGKGRKSIIFKIGQPISMKLLEFFVAQGFKESPHFTKSGILYVNNSHLIVTGPIGNDRLQANCQKDDCDKILNDFEELLKNLE